MDPGLGTRRHHQARSLAEVALCARSHEIALDGCAPSCDGNDVVNVQHDAGLAGGATAVPAAEAVSLEDGESEPRGDCMTGWGHVALHRRAGDGPMAPVGVYVPGRPGDPMRIVNTDNPGLTPLGRDPDPPEPHRRRHPAVETPSQVCADRQQPEQSGSEAASVVRAPRARPIEQLQHRFGRSDPDDQIETARHAVPRGRIMLTPARPFDPGDQDGTPAAAVKRLFPMRPGAQQDQVPGRARALEP